MSTKTVKKEKMHISVIIAIIVAAVIVAAAFAFAVWRNSDAALEGSVAMKVGDTEITYPEFSYYYNSEVNYFINTYSESGLLSYLGIDTSKSLASQKCSFDEKKTWAEYFAESAKSRLEQTYIVYLESQKAEFEADKKAIEDNIALYKAAFEENASENKVSVDYYIKHVYGNGVTWDKFQTYLERALIANQYQDFLKDGITVTDNEIEKYFNENQAAYYSADYRSVSYSYTADGDTKRDDAKAHAEEFASKVTDEKSYIDLAWANLDDKTKESYEKAENTDYSLKTGATPSALTSEASKWLISADRKAGDVTVIEDTTAKNFTVYYFVSCKLKDYKVVNLREIYVAASEEGAEEKAKEILGKWNASGKTEDDFKALVAEYNPDMTNEGLYENVTSGYMPDVVDKWIFDEARKPGDVELIYDEESKDSKGFHIVYYASQGDEYWKYSVRLSLVSQKYSDKYTGIAKNYEVTANDSVISRITKA